MKLRILMLLLLVVLIAGCKEINYLTSTKPVIVDGFGVLSQLENKQLSDKELLKLVKAVTQRKSVSKADAESLLAIYKHHAERFLIATVSPTGDETVLWANDVEKYLALILQHEGLRQAAAQTTQAIIVNHICNSARFDSSDQSGAGGAAGGSLAGVFVRAYRQAAAKDDEELRRKILNERQAANMQAVIEGFELAAREIITNQRADVTAQQRAQAAEFLKDLQTYNATLPSDAKILDENNQLINPARMNDEQKGSVDALFGVGTGKDYGIRLSNRMHAALNQLKIDTREQIK